VARISAGVAGAGCGRAARGGHGVRDATARRDMRDAVRWPRRRSAARWASAAATSWPTPGATRDASRLSGAPGAGRRGHAIGRRGVRHRLRAARQQWSSWRSCSTRAAALRSVVSPRAPRRQRSRPRRCSRSPSAPRPRSTASHGRAHRGAGRRRPLPPTAPKPPAPVP
jgi:hypothetical protein